MTPLPLRNADLQPVRQELKRKLIHLSSVVLPLGYWIIGPSKGTVVLGGLTVIALITEGIRLRTAWGRAVYGRFFGSMTRAAEQARLTGASYVFIGAFLSALLFEPTIATLAMLFMSLGDGAAALVGMRYGSIRMGHKSLQGTLACLLTCLLIATQSELSPVEAVAGALSATAAEVLSRPPIDDNIAIPLFSGAVMTWLTVRGL